MRPVQQGLRGALSQSWLWEAKSENRLLENQCLATDIEQPLPGRNSIYLAYFLPKELENFSSEVCEALNERFDVSVHR